MTKWNKYFWAVFRSCITRFEMTAMFCLLSVACTVIKWWATWRATRIVTAPTMSSWLLWLRGVYKNDIWLWRWLLIWQRAAHRVRVQQLKSLTQFTYFCKLLLFLKVVQRDRVKALQLGTEVSFLNAQLCSQQSRVSICNRRITLQIVCCCGTLRKLRLWQLLC